MTSSKCIMFRVAVSRTAEAQGWAGPHLAAAQYLAASAGEGRPSTVFAFDTGLFQDSLLGSPSPATPKCECSPSHLEFMETEFPVWNRGSVFCKSPRQGDGLCQYFVGFCNSLSGCMGAQIGVVLYCGREMQLDFFFSVTCSFSQDNFLCPHSRGWVCSCSACCCPCSHHHSIPFPFPVGCCSCSVASFQLSGADHHFLRGVLFCSSPNVILPALLSPRGCQ